MKRNKLIQTSTEDEKKKRVKLDKKNEKDRARRRAEMKEQRKTRLARGIEQKEKQSLWKRKLLGWSAWSDNTHDFRIRQSVVLRALRWLNNKIKIDHAALSKLPVDGDLTGLHTMKDTLTDVEELQSTNDKNPHDIGTFIPVAARKMTEEEAVQKSVKDHQSSAHKQVVPWPS